MAHLAQNYEAEEGGFDYPPVPGTYIDLYSAFDAYNEHQPRTPNYLAGPSPSFYHSQGYQAVASSTVPPRDFPTPDHGHQVPVIKQVALAPSPVLSSENGASTSPAFTDHTLASTDAANTKFVPYSAKASKRKRPRGTTGTFTCDTCGGKFTRADSVQRHNRVCHGSKQPFKNSIITQPKNTNTRDGSITSDPSFHAITAIRIQPASSTEQSQDARANSSLYATPSASTVTDVSGAEKASLMSDLETCRFSSQKPMWTQSYTPRGPDTSADHMTFFCDLCPEFFERRDILQIHKSRIHGLTEIPYSPASGVINRPWYLTDVTHENANRHSLRALKAFEGGGLSTSPCQSCISKGLECIVNPFFSQKCSYCNHRDSGAPCGAAGVKHFKPRKTADYPDEVAGQRNNGFHIGYEAGIKAKTADRSVVTIRNTVSSDPDTAANTPPYSSNEHSPVSQ